MHRQKIIRRFLVAFLAGLFIFFAVYMIGIVNVRVNNQSMWPTYEDGDRLLILKKMYCHIQNDDVVMFKAPDKSDVYYIKRVKGSPNDVIQIREGSLYINEIWDASNQKFGPMNTEAYFLRVNPGYFFLLSDNRNLENAKDSRQFGPVSLKQIVGKVIIKLPF